MNFVATLIFSTLSIRWPLVGIVSFLLAYTGMAGFFEELGILGVTVGGMRPDTVAAAVSILVLLRRPPTIKIPDTVTAMVWIITFTVPAGVFCVSTDMYGFVASSWRVFFWAPTFLALLRLTETEWEWLRNILVILLAINGLLTAYIVYTGDYELYRRLSLSRSFLFDEWHVAVRMANITDTLRLNLQGTFTFASITVFLCLNRLFSPNVSTKQRTIFFALLVCILYAVYITLTRTSALALMVGATAMMFPIFLRTKMRQQAYLFALIIAVCLTVYIFMAQHSGAARAWYERFAGYEDEYSSVYTRWDNNVTYWNILIRSYAIIGHPGFVADDVAVGGYNDVVAPLAMWWYYGLVAAFCYTFVMIFFAWWWVKLLRSDIPPDQRIPAFALFGMFLTFQIETFGGAVPLNFDFAFCFSFILASCAGMIFPKLPLRTPRRSRLVPV